MDLSKYREAKEKAGAAIQKVGKAFIIVMPKFDPNTGVEVDPEVQTISKEQLTAMKKDLNEKLAELKAIEDEMDAATAVAASAKA